MKKIGLVMLLVLLVSAMALVCACSCDSGGKDVQLKYDNGKLSGARGIGGPGWGSVVAFSPTSVPYTINKVHVCGKLVGSGEGLTFDIVIWDKEQKELYNSSFASTLFSASPGWVDIKVPMVVVNNNFYVVVIPNASKDNGVYIGYDTSANNGHSAVVKNWQSQPTEVNWMIRVSGS